MEKVHHYGGDGMKERAEYAPLNPERRLGLYVDAAEALEAVLEQAHQIAGMTGSVEVGPEVSLREAYIQSNGIDTDCDEVLFANVATGAVMRWRQPMKKPIEKSVLVRHEAYRTGPKEEEYILSVQREIPGVVNSFYAIYTIEYFKGGGVQAMVALNNIPVNENETASQERHMTEYDVDEFEKEVNDVISYMSTVSEENSRLHALKLAME